MMVILAVSHHMSVVSSNFSATARTSVPVSSQRRGSVLSVVLRPRSTSSSVSLLRAEELVTKCILSTWVGRHLDGSEKVDAGVAWKAFERIVLDDTTIWEELSIHASKITKYQRQ